MLVGFWFFLLLFFHVVPVIFFLFLFLFLSSSSSSATSTRTVFVTLSLSLFSFLPELEECRRRCRLLPRLLVVHQSHCLNNLQLRLILRTSSTSIRISGSFFSGHLIIRFLPRRLSPLRSVGRSVEKTKTSGKSNNLMVSDCLGSGRSCSRRSRRC